MATGSASRNRNLPITGPVILIAAEILSCWQLRLLPAERRDSSFNYARGPHSNSIEILVHRICAVAALG